MLLHIKWDIRLGDTMLKASWNVSFLFPNYVKSDQTKY